MSNLYSLNLTIDSMNAFKLDYYSARKSFLILNKTAGGLLMGSLL